MKVFIRTLSGFTTKEEREVCRRTLNDLNFYVLTGIDDRLEVYAIRYEEESWVTNLGAIIARWIRRKQIG